MKEIEIKFKLNDVSKIFEKLEKIKAVGFGSCSQRNKYFKHPKLDCIARVRENRIRDIKVDRFTGEDKYFEKFEYLFTVKYKDECQNSFIKCREEKEAIVDLGSALSMLYCLDFDELFLVNKAIRTTFTFNNCVIDIDEDVEVETWIGNAKHTKKNHVLGQFVEIESADKEDIRKMLDILGLKEKDAVKESYYELAANWKKEKEDARKKSNKRRNSNSKK